MAYPIPMSHASSEPGDLKRCLRLLDGVLPIGEETTGGRRQDLCRLPLFSCCDHVYNLVTSLLGLLL